MMRSRVIFVSYLMLCGLPACGGSDGETADPPHSSGSAGEQGLAGSGWGSAGTSGELDAGQAGAAGESGSAGAVGNGGSAGEGSGGTAGDGSGGTAGDGSGGSGGSDGGIGGFTANGGSGGSGGTGGKGGIGGFTANGGSGGSGGTGGGIGGFTSNGGSGGTGGYVGIIPFAASITSTDFEILCTTSGASLGGNYTAKYSNLLLATPTQAAVVKSHALLKKNGVTASYSFPVDPVLAPKVSQGNSVSVVHKALKGSGTANLCNFCNATMTLEVEWLLGNGESRSDKTDPFTVKCFVPI